MPQAIEVLSTEVFPVSTPADSELFLRLDDWSDPVTYFVGRNGSGKSKTARVIARKVPNSLYLSTDRLIGVMSISSSPNGASINAAKPRSTDEFGV
ncbi:hypothetical protein ACIQF8_17535 [Pseudarthrobacter sp. NPDC092184]|uniref:hypothetical protein n=1 Tax=unclassified Pseudarthrobacter TaxID=2647000 RepID=UPI0038202308